MPTLLLLAAAAVPLAPAAADEAIARQQAEVREAVATNPCRPSATPEEIVVCGRAFQPMASSPVSGYEPGRDFAAPERGPWFELRRGPLSISCCGIATSNGTGAGLSFRIRF